MIPGTLKMAIIKELTMLDRCSKLLAYCDKYVCGRPYPLLKTALPMA
jgi:hypothetical protein